MDAPRSLLLAIFRRLEQHSLPALVGFCDGSAYELQVLSTTHAEEGEGDDIVADIIRVAAPGAIHFASGTCMNFKLADVVRVVVAGECVFSQRTDA